VLGLLLHRPSLLDLRAALVEGLSMLALRDAPLLLPLCVLCASGRRRTSPLRLSDAGPAAAGVVPLWHSSNSGHRKQQQSSDKVSARAQSGWMLGALLHASYVLISKAPSLLSFSSVCIPDNTDAVALPQAAVADTAQGHRG
jgi:hypothetical protein